MKTFIFLFGIVAYCSAMEDNCPDTDISPCTCRPYFDGACIITCSLSSQGHTENIAEIPNLCNGHVHFVLVHSKISGIPAKLWKTLLSSKTVDISIKHSGMEGLIPPSGESIPDVYSPGPAVIKFDHMKVGEWDWKQLNKFYSEKELTLVIDDTPLSEISFDFSHIAQGQVHKVAIDSAGLKEIPDALFANFKDLNSLSLQNNQLTAVSRFMMPTPAEKLAFLHLNGNKLTTIPGDLFAGMPSLQVVYLRDNKLSSIPEDLFHRVSSRKLRLDFLHNPWECNCKLMWILRNTKYHVQMGSCASPEELAGRKVRDLYYILDC